MNSDFKKLRAEIGRRLEELRNTAMNRASPEAVAEVAREKHIKIGARTIRKLEEESGDMNLSSLVALLCVYGMTVGDFLRFDQQGEDPRLIGEILQIMRDPVKRKTLRALLTVLRSDNP